MWDSKPKFSGRMVFPVVLAGMVLLSGCSTIPTFSFKNGNATQVAQVEGSPENLKDATGGNPDENTGTKAGERIGNGNKTLPVSNSQNEASAPSNLDRDPNSTQTSSSNSSIPAPSPQPAPSNTPIRPFYELAGSPPTAPGLAMKQRVFMAEPPKIAYLTIDDGPSDNTVSILNTLQAEGVRATFFVIGRQVERYPDLLKQAFEQGNAIGNHTYSHNYAEIYKSPKDYLANIKKNEDLIYQLIGIRPRVIRTPGGTQGNFHVSYYNAVDAADYLVYDWNVSTGDAAAPLVPASQIVSNIMSQVPGKDRVIILMHDAPGKTTTAEALPQIIQYLKKQGFEFGVLTPEVAPILFPGGFKS